MPIPPIVALCGAPGAGKTAVGQRILSHASRHHLRCYVFDCIYHAWEVEAVRARGGVVVRVRRPGYHEAPSLADIPEDYVLDNTGDLYGLALRVDQLLATLAAPLAAAQHEARP